MAYFDIFNHPITQQECCRLLGMSSLEFMDEITPLISRKMCFRYGEYFSPSANIQTLALSRQQKEIISLTYFNKLKKYTRIISRFPFVRGIAVSGSLSKGTMQEGGDIDFFILTAPGRLWLCRSLLIMYKKIMLFNSHKYFCLNYFVDENNMNIIDKNIFTATEIFYLMPVYSEKKTLDRFFISNQWINQYYCENTSRNEDFFVTTNSRLKKIAEKLAGGRMGNLAEKWFHSVTLKKWLRSFGHFSAEKFELTMRSTTGVSKHHPRDFQSKVLKMHQEKVNAIVSR